MRMIQYYKKMLKIIHLQFMSASSFLIKFRISKRKKTNNSFFATKKKKNYNNKRRNKEELNA
jgi:hypothetical protein